MLALLSSSPVEWMLAFILFFSSLGTILLRHPVHACLSFLLTLFALAAFYVQLSAQFIGVMQVLVYAGAIMVIFMFVIVLFQDAHAQIERLPAQSSRLLIAGAVLAIILGVGVLGEAFLGFQPSNLMLPDDYGTAQSLGRELYRSFFFPFEAIIVLFLVAIMGALYIARRAR